MKKGQFAVLLVFVFLIYFSIHWIAYFNDADARASEFVGTDTYTRLVKVEDFHEKKVWYDHMIADSNAPYGDEIHWTRPMDLLLYGGTMLLSPWMRFSEALKWSGIWISPILGALSILALLWSCKGFIKPQSGILLYTLFLFQFIVQGYFQFGRPDHHSLLLLSFVLFLGASFRLMDDRYNKKSVGLAAGIGAFAIWVSVESLVFTGLTVVILGLLWVIYGKDYAKRLWQYALATGIYLIGVILIENGPTKISIVVYDQVSSVHVFLFLLMGAAFFIADRGHVKKMKLRLLAGLVMIVVGMLFVNNVYPEFLEGPFAKVNPAIVPIWLSKVVEVQPIKTVGSIIQYLGLMITAVFYLVLKVYKEKGKVGNAVIYMIAGVMLFIMMSVYQVRWAGYGQLIALLPAVMMLEQLMEYLSEYRLRFFLRTLLLVVVTMGYLVVGILVSSENTGVGKNAISLKPFASWMVEMEMDDGNILAYIDYGPELMYRTDLKVVSAPYHRNDSGILFAYDVMVSTDMSFVFERLEERRVRYILISDATSESNFYGTQVEKSLFCRLRESNMPGYLEEVKLPDELSDYKLFVFLDKI